MLLLLGRREPRSSCYFKALYCRPWCACGGYAHAGHSTTMLLQYWRWGRLIISHSSSLLLAFSLSRSLSLSFSLLWLPRFILVEKRLQARNVYPLAHDCRLYRQNFIYYYPSSPFSTDPLPFHLAAVVLPLLRCPGQTHLSTSCLPDVPAHCPPRPMHQSRWQAESGIW